MGGRLDAALFLLMSIFWALNFPLVKVALDYVSPFQLTLLRLLVALPFLAALMPRSLRPLRGLRSNLLVALFGALDLFLFTTLWFLGERYVTPSLSVIIIYTYPLLILMLSGAILGERIARVRAIGALAGFAGIAVAYLGYFAAYSPAGPLLLLGASASFSLAAIVYRRYLAGEDFARVTFYHIVYAALMAAALLAALGQLRPVPLTPELATLLLLVGFPGTALAYAIYVYLYSKHELGMIAPYLFLVPAFSILLSYLLLRAAITPYELGGFALLAVGIYLSSRG